MSTYIIVRATQEEARKDASTYNPTESIKITQIKKQPNIPQALARIKIRKKIQNTSRPRPSHSKDDSYRNIGESPERSKKQYKKGPKQLESRE